MDIIGKACSRCESFKELNCFHLSKYRKDGFNSICKCCVSLRDKGLLPRHPSRIPISDIESTKIISMYQSGMGSKTIAKLLKLSPNKTYKIIKNAGISRSSLKVGISTKVDTTFFSIIDTEDKAYILGLLYSDGNITPYYSKYGRISSYKIRIRLQEKDHLILRKISNIMCGEDLVTIQLRENLKWQNVASFQIGNITLGEDLIELGCVPNKSGIISMPTYKQVPDHLYIHFLRGFYDGDGGIKKTPPIVMSFTSNKNMCVQLQQYFKDKYGILFKDYYERKNGYGSIVISGRDNCYDLYKLLYSSCNLFLNRKKETIEKVLITINESPIEHLSKNRQRNIITKRDFRLKDLQLKYPPI